MNFVGVPQDLKIISRVPLGKKGWDQFRYVPFTKNMASFSNFLGTCGVGVKGQKRGD